MTAGTERPQGPGLYRVSAPDGSEEMVVAVETGPRGLVCVPDDPAVPPVLVSQIPPGSLLWRREP